MTFDEWWKLVNEFWEKNDVDCNDIERESQCKAAWETAIKAERERCVEIARNNRFGFHTEYEEFAAQKNDAIVTDIQSGE